MVLIHKTHFAFVILSDIHLASIVLATIHLAFLILDAIDLAFVVLASNLWKLNPGVRTITLTKIANYTCKLHTKENEYGAEH